MSATPVVSPEAHRMFIGGKQVDARTAEVIEVRDPCTADVFATVPAGGTDEIDDAVSSAQAAHEDGRWRLLSRRERAQTLLRLALLIETHHSTLAELDSRGTGRPIQEMRAQLRRIPEWFEYFASVLRTEETSVTPYEGDYLNYTLRVPIGVVGQITPWNHPILIWVKKLAPALASGNSIVVKPSELAPLGPLRLAELCAEAGIPDGVVNVVTGYGATAGARLADHPMVRKVDLTGGTNTGKIAAAAAGSHLADVTAELGGKAAVVVFDDVDMDEAVSNAAFAAFVATGQTCVQGARILVQGRNRAEELTRRLADRVRLLKVGYSLDPQTQLGPLISEAQRRRVAGMVEQAGEYADVIACSRIPTEPPLDRGYYYPASIISAAAPDSVIAQEEVFGPVVVVLPFETESQAIAIANSTQFGLASSVWTSDVSRAHRVAGSLDCGVVWINDHHRIDPSSPWGGLRDSGLGSENGIDAYRAYTRVRSIVVKTSAEPFDWYAPSSQEKRYS